MAAKENRRETVDIVRDLVNEVNVDVRMVTITDNLDQTYTITTCDTSYLYPCFKFGFGGVDYEVINEVGKEFVVNKKFTIKGSSVPAGDYLELPSPKYYYGTVMATKAELDKEALNSNKFPMVYFLTPTRDRFGAREASVDRESTIRLVFLTEANEMDWLNESHYSYAIKPMRNLVYRFVNYLDFNENIGEIDNFDILDHAKFGVYATDKGHTKRIFSEQSSGSELELTLPIYKGGLCIDGC